MDNRIGKKLGNYRLIRLIGEGGFAQVYLGEHIYLERPAAIKAIKAQLAEEDREVFIREARTIASLDHPHIVRILDFGIEDNIPFIVMEYAPRGSLVQIHPRDTVLQFDIIISYINQISSALQYAHDHKLVHRDVKPQNMLMKQNGDILLSDFGIAQIAHSSSSMSMQEIVGTPMYMAPEQFQGKPTIASDQYALGVVTYQWLCGRSPFHGNYHQLVYMNTMVSPPSLREIIPSIPVAVEQVVMKSLAKKPEERFASVRDFAKALEEASRHATIQVDQTQPRGTPSGSQPGDTASVRGSAFSQTWGAIPNQEIPSYRSPWIDPDVTAYGSSPLGAPPQFPYASPGQAKSLFERMKTQAQDLFHKIDPLRKNVVMHAQDLQQKITPLSEQIGMQTLKFLQNSEQAIKNTPFRPSSRLPGSSTILFPTSVASSTAPTSFFISYHKSDRPWAEWIAWELEAENHSVILPTWDFQLGSHIKDEMQKAAAKVECTILVLSPDFLNMPSVQQEWIAIFHKSVVSGQNLFLPVCVRECGHKLENLFGSTIHIDITEQDETTARKLLLDGVRNQRRKPNTQPHFPGMQTTRISSNPTPDSRPDLSIKSQPQPPSLRDIEIFVSYSHNDKELRNELEKDLNILKRQYDITSWSDGEIPAGREWAHEIEEHLSKADIILLLISPDFLASNYCYEEEMMKAMMRHEAKEAYVIPIVLRPALWEISPFGKLQALPTGGHPITLWDNRDAAFLDVAKGIQRAVEHLTKK